MRSCSARARGLASPLAGFFLRGHDHEGFDEARVAALLAVAHGRATERSELACVRRALRKQSEGETTLALMELALANLPKLQRPEEAAWRLSAADGLLKAGLPPREMLAALGIESSTIEPLDRAYNPDQPRVPAGSGRESGQWTTGDNSGDSGSGETGRSAPPADGEPNPLDGIQIADSSADWVQYLNPVASAQAAEVGGDWASSGAAPNIQHQQGVQSAISDYQALGYSITSNHATYVDIPGFDSPRVYDFIVQDPVTGEYIGVEVKKTYFDTIYLNRSQVDKDTTLYEGNVGFAQSLNVVVTRVAYEAYCGGCVFINVRYWYLAERLAEAGIEVTQHIYPGGAGAPYLRAYYESERRRGSKTCRIDNQQKERRGPISRRNDSIGSFI